MAVQTKPASRRMTVESPNFVFDVTILCLLALSMVTGEAWAASNGDAGTYGMWLALYAAVTAGVTSMALFHVAGPCLRNGSRDKKRRFASLFLRLLGNVAAVYGCLWGFCPILCGPLSHSIAFRIVGCLLMSAGTVIGIVPWPKSIQQGARLNATV